ncbi:MAG TPA: hypothetical protein VJ949_10175 [Cryomorphaceae bacterium]|nr:hypothetical protein [Cryomorphaceae bacterium]
MASNETQTWPDLAIGLYDKLTGRNAKISYDFDQMEIDVPSGTKENEHAKWRVNGKVTISTTEGADKSSAN